MNDLHLMTDTTSERLQDTQAVPALNTQLPQKSLCSTGIPGFQNPLYRNLDFVDWRAVLVHDNAGLCTASSRRTHARFNAGQTVGIREVADQIWLVSFMDYELGFFDKDEGRIEPGPNPFAPEKVLTMSPV
jgi:putative transposase